MILRLLKFQSQRHNCEWKGADVVELNKNNRCIKLQLPDGTTVDILTAVLYEMDKWIQSKENKTEAGGYVVGYLHQTTKNVSLELVSHPYFFDYRTRVRFILREARHSLFLKKHNLRRSYYMGVWHTHPQNIPEPSFIDWEDWRKTLEEDKTVGRYVFFIIVGIQKYRIWVGDFITRQITEIYEVPMDFDGLYITEGR